MAFEFPAVVTVITMRGVISGYLYSASPMVITLAVPLFQTEYLETIKRELLLTKRDDKFRYVCIPVKTIGVAGS